MPMTKLAILVAATVAAGATILPAATIYLRDNTTAYSGNAVTQTTFDDTWVSGVVGGNGGTTNNGAASNFTLRTPANGTFDAGLLGIKNLFTLLPATNGNGDGLQINSATLHLYANSAFAGDGGASLTIYRMTSDWMGLGAGSNEGNASGRYRIVNTATNWASGNSFSTSDYTATNAVTLATWNVSTSPYLNDVNVTALLQDIYGAGYNYGFALRTNSLSIRQIRASEASTISQTPVLEINYQYVAVPEPAALGLLAVSGVGLIVRRRHHAEE